MSSFTLHDNGMASWQSDDDVYRVDAFVTLRGAVFDEGKISILKSGAEVFSDSTFLSGGGGFEDARDVLELFASFADADQESHTFGNGDGCLWKESEWEEVAQSVEPLHEFLTLHAESLSMAAVEYNEGGGEYAA